MLHVHLGRLVRENNRKLNATYAYVYDNGGNIITKTKYSYSLSSLLGSPTKTYDYSYTNPWRDQLTSWDGKTFIYDNAGNPTTYKGRPLTWTRGRLLKSYDRNDAVYPMTFKYNANGIRIQKQQLFHSHGETTTYTLDGTNILKETKFKSGMSGSYTYTQEYIYGHQGLIGFYSSSIKYLYGKNIQGDITDIYDRIGNCVARYTYDAWGNHKVCNPDGSVNTSSDFIGNINPFRYRGYYYDVETGLYYLQSRYFDPETGRFINADTIDYLDPSNLGGLNLYSYCNNNPIMYYDPSGHSMLLALIVAGAIAGAVTGGIYGAVNAVATGENVLWGVFLGSVSGTLMGAITGAASYFIAPLVSSVTWTTCGLTKMGAALLGTGISIIGNGIIGTLNSVATQAVNNGKVDLNTAFRAGVYSAMSYTAMAWAGSALGITKLLIDNVFSAIGLSILEAPLAFIFNLLNDWWK